MKRSNWYVRFATLLPLLFVGVGCSDSVSGPDHGEDVDLQPGYALVAQGTEVPLRAEADGFEPGAPVTLFLENGSNEDLGYNLCFHALERRSGSEWEMEEDGRICTTVLNILSPGAVAEYGTTLPEDLAPGEYRFRVALFFMTQEEHRDQVSGSFQIEG